MLKQAFDSIAANTAVPYRSLKKCFIYHKLLLIAIYYLLNFQIKNYKLVYTIITMYICPKNIQCSNHSIFL